MIAILESHFLENPIMQQQLKRKILNDQGSVLKGNEESKEAVKDHSIDMLL